MTDETDRAWRAEFAHRYVARMLLRPPWPPPPVYVRMTDEEIDELPEELRQFARIRRDVLDAFAAFAALGGRIGDTHETARQGGGPEAPIRSDQIAGVSTDQTAGSERPQAEE